MDAHWYILFVITGQEENLIQFFEREGVYCFAPKREAIFRKAGVSTIVTKNMFPGYLFFPSMLTQREFHALIVELRARHSGIIRELHYGNEDTAALLPEEQHFLESLLNKDHILETSKGMIENDQVIITEGPLKGHESKITKIDRHKRIAILEVTLLGRNVHVTVGLEVIRKVNDKTVEENAA